MIAYKNAISRQPTNGVTGLLKINKVKRWAERKLTVKKGYCPWRHCRI